MGGLSTGGRDNCERCEEGGTRAEMMLRMLRKVARVGSRGAQTVSQVCPTLREQHAKPCSRGYRH
jgi:hypothetical protein